MQSYKSDANNKAFKSQQILYKSLRALLKIKPLSDISVSDLVKESGISRTTFYRNFNSIVDVLEFAFEWFYKNYMELRVGQKNQLGFFLQYWNGHKDLITIIASQNSGIIKSIMLRNSGTTKNNQYLFDMKYSMMTSILETWSNSRTETPEELEKILGTVLNQSAIDILLN